MGTRHVRRDGMREASSNWLGPFPDGAAGGGAGPSHSGASGVGCRLATVASIFFFSSLLFAVTLMMTLSYSFHTFFMLLLCMQC